MGVVTDILTTDQLHDLWGAGYTIALRGHDPYDIPLNLIPRGMSYQWNPIQPDADVKEVAIGWAAVPYSRHEGVFAPWGTPGDIECGGLRLCEKPTEDVIRRQRRAVENQARDWEVRAADLGLTGAVRIGTQTEINKLDTFEERQIGTNTPGEIIRAETKTIETTVRLPSDMIPHMGLIFDERDRLEAEVVRKDRTLAPGDIADKFYAAIDADKAAPWWPTLRAILLPIAVENVRKTLKETPDE